MLSVCCVSGGPPGRLAALLALVRPVASELVVAVDERVDPRRLGGVRELADTLWRYPYADPPDRPRQWLHEQARGEWVLWLDDDEAPSQALLEAAAAPPGDVTHCFVPRRWLWRDGFIVDPPWRPDWQLRLVRRSAARFPGILHVPIQASGPHRYLEAPLYHLDLLVKDRARREEQVRRFERARPGLRVAGRPINEAYYLPESRDPAVEPVPADDAPLVAALLEAPEPAAVEAPDLPLARREEIDARWADRALPESAYRARIEVLELDPLVAGEVRQLDVRVTNEGTETWAHGPDGLPEIRLSYRPQPDALRTPLPHDLPPGVSALVPVAVRAPGQPGRHRLTIDLVHERHRWFDCGAELELEVLPRRRALVLVGQPPGDEAFDARVDAVLAGLDPALEPVLVGPKAEWLRDRFALPASGELPPGAFDAVAVVPAGRRRDRLRLRLAAARARRRR